MFDQLAQAMLVGINQCGFRHCKKGGQEDQ